MVCFVLCVCPVCFLSITASGFFTILYSMEWGAEKANEWLITFLMSFFQNVIVIQPVKVRVSLLPASSCLPSCLSGAGLVLSMMLALYCL